MIKLDCLGDICPIPLIKLQRALQDSPANESILLVTDSSCTLRSIEEFCRPQHIPFQSDEVILGVWEITITNKRIT